MARSDPSGPFIKLSAPETEEFWKVPVLYEDDALFALDKPARLLTSPDRYDANRPKLMRILHRDIERGAPWVVAYAINDFNQIVGSSDDGNDVKPFITGLNQSTPTPIPLISGDSSGDAYGINNSAVVVGESGGKAFIWQDGYSDAIDLNNFKPPGLSGLTLKCAEAINHNGVIVGWGIDGGGNRRAFMLSPQ